MISSNLITDQESNQLDDSASRPYDEARQTITKEPPFGFPPSESQLLRASTELLPKASLESVDGCSEGHNPESKNDSTGDDNNNLQAIKIDIAKTIQQ